MPPIRKFWSAKTNVIFVWPGEEDLVIGYDAMRFIVPPRNKTARKGTGLPYTHESARDGSERMIPGTILVEDITEERVGGGIVQRLSVDLFCRFLERDREDLFLRGFNIVKNLSDVEPAMQAGLPLYNASQDERARNILATELERQKRFADKGQPAPPSSSGHLVEWAIQHLQNRPVEVPKYNAADITSVLEGRLSTVPAQRIPEPDPVFERAATTNLEVYRSAVALDVKLTKGELEALLQNDTEMIALVVRKIEAKRTEEKTGEPVGPLV